MKFLLDTNFVIGLNNLDPNILAKLQELRVDYKDCCISVITYLEVLGFSGNTEDDIQAFKELMGYFTCSQLTNDIQQQTISLRRKHKIKLPDSIILATAQVHDLKILTFDQKLMKYSDKTSQKL